MTGRAMRRLGAGLAMAVAAVAAPVVTAAPAQAVSQTAIHPEWVDGCEGCPGPVFLVEAVLDHRIKARVTTSVRTGLSGLLSASRTTDPVAAARVHAAAIRTLQGAAAQAGNAAWGADEWDGDLCPRKPWPWPGPGPQWDVLERQLSEGMTLLGRANRGDQAALRAATEDLDAGVTGLTAFQGCV